MTSKSNIELQIQEGRREAQGFEITKNLRVQVSTDDGWEHAVVDELPTDADPDYYQIFLTSDREAHRPLHVKREKIREIDGTPWDDEVRMKFVQMVKKLAENLDDLDQEGVHALLSNEVSKIDSAFTYCDDDDVVLKILEENDVDGEKVLGLTKDEYQNMLAGVMEAGGRSDMVLGTPEDMRQRAIRAIWTAIERVQDRHRPTEETKEQKERYDKLWEKLPRFQDGRDPETLRPRDGKACVPRAFIDLDTRRYGVFFFAYVTNQVQIGQNNDLWMLLDFLALRMSTPVCVRLLNFFIDDFSKFDPDDKKVLSLCKNTVEGSEFPIATALLMAAFMEELSKLDRQNKEMYVGGDEADLEKSIGVGNFQDYFIESASEILETVESDHLALILLECPTNLPGGDEALSALDIALRFRLRSFMASSRITRITGTMWTEANLLKPSTTFRVKEIQCCDYSIGLWNCWSGSKRAQGPKIWFYTPFGKFITEVLSYLLFAGFFFLVTFMRRNIYTEFDIIEFFLYMCIVGFFMKEFWDMLDDWREYFFEDYVNWMDMTIMLCFVCTVIVKMDERFEWGGPTECDETCAKFCEGVSTATPYVPYPFMASHAYPTPLAADYYSGSGDLTGDNAPHAIYDTEDGKPRHPILTFHDPDAGDKAVRKDLKYCKSKVDGTGEQVADVSEATCVEFPVYFADWGTLYAHGATAASVGKAGSEDSETVAHLAAQAQHMQVYTSLFHPAYFNHATGFRKKAQKFASYGTVNGDGTFSASWGSKGEFQNYEGGCPGPEDDENKYEDQPGDSDEVKKEKKALRGDDFDACDYSVQGLYAGQQEGICYDEDLDDCVNLGEGGGAHRMPCAHYTDYTGDDADYDQVCPQNNLFHEADGSADYGPEPVGWFWNGSYLRYSDHHHAERNADGHTHAGDADKWEGDWETSDVKPAKIAGTTCSAPVGAAPLQVEDKYFSNPVHSEAGCGQGAWHNQEMNCQALVVSGRSLFYKIIWSMIVILITFRVLWFLILFEELGKFHKICLLMLRPLFTFMAFLLIICIGFAVAFYYVAGDTAVETFFRFQDSMWWTVNAVQGDIDYDPIIADNSWDYGDQIRVGSYTAAAALGTGITALAKAQGIIFDPPLEQSRGNYDNFNYGIEGPPELQNVDESRSIYLKSLMYVFLCFGCVMMINLLVAVMATVYEEIEEDAYDQIQYERGKNAIIKDRATGMLPAPFNILVMMCSALCSFIELFIILTSYYIDLQPFGLKFKQEREDQEIQEQLTMRMSARSSRKPSDRGEKKDTKQKNQIVLDPVEGGGGDSKEVEDSQHLEYSQGDHEASYISGGGSKLSSDDEEDHGPEDEPCCTCCNFFGCQLKRGPAQRNPDGSYDTGYGARLKGAFAMVWGGDDAGGGWWCSYCNSFIDPKVLGANYEANLLDLFYQKYEEEKSPLDTQDKLMLREMQPKLCPACYRMKDPQSRGNVLTDIISYYSFLILLYIPFSLILFPLWFFYRFVKIAMRSKFRKLLSTNVDSEDTLVMPHPRDVRADFGNTEKFTKLLKGPFASNPIWACAENGLGKEVKFGNDTKKHKSMDDNGRETNSLDLKTTYGFNMDRTLHVIWVAEGSPLDRAGVKAGWQITDVNDDPVSSMEKPDALVKGILREGNMPIEIRFNNEKLAVQNDDISDAMNREKATQAATSDLTDGALDAIRQILNEMGFGGNAKAVELGSDS